MMMRTWTNGIHDLVETLTTRVRVLSLKHVCEGWTDLLGTSDAVIRTIQDLISAGLLVGDVWNLPPSPVDDAPVAVWTPGFEPPDFPQIVDFIQSRWDESIVPVPVVAATHKAGRLFGSSTGGLPPQNHRNQDLLLAEVYFRYRCHQPRLARTWLGEDAVAMAERGVKNPDAFLFDNDGSVVRVVESAGRYGLKQLESIHQHCRLADLPYELW